VQLSLDDLILINRAVTNGADAGSVYDARKPPQIDQIALKVVEGILERTAATAVDEPIELATQLAAYVSWARPFGATSDRTALVTMAVVLDLAKMKMPRDWSGCAELLLSLGRSGEGPSGRSTRLKEWLDGATSPAPR
jgi:hypothetical protein